jgi:phthalate 4,5-cis-dihydrodiol dehydrogenase
VEVHSPQGRQFIAAQLPAVPRAEVIDELWGVTRLDHAPRHDGAWSRATLEVCLAMLAGEARAENLRYQVPTRD